MAENLQKLKIKSKISIWKYRENTKNYSGFYLHIDSHKDEFVQFLKVISKKTFQCKKSFSCIDPNSKVLSMVNNSSGKAKYKHFDTFTLITNQSKFVETYFVIEENEKKIEIKMGSKVLERFLSLLEEDILDQGVSDIDENEILNIW